VAAVVEVIWAEAGVTWVVVIWAAELVWAELEPVVLVQPQQDLLQAELVQVEQVLLAVIVALLIEVTVATEVIEAATEVIAEIVVVEIIPLTTFMVMVVADGVAGASGAVMEPSFLHSVS
jgi:hypothetical protein